MRLLYWIPVLPAALLACSAWAQSDGPADPRLPAMVVPVAAPPPAVVVVPTSCPPGTSAAPHTAAAPPTIVNVTITEPDGCTTRCVPVEIPAAAPARVIRVPPPCPPCDEVSGCDPKRKGTPTCEIHKHRHSNYAVKKVEYSLPCCSLLGLFCMGCKDSCGCKDPHNHEPGCRDGCPDHKCGKVRIKKILMKQIITEEQMRPRCKPDCCEFNCGPVVPAIPHGTVIPPVEAPALVPGKVPAKEIELIPAPKKD